MHMVVHTSMVYRWRAPFIKTCSPETGKGVEPNMAGPVAAPRLVIAGAGRPGAPTDITRNFAEQ